MRGQLAAEQSRCFKLEVYMHTVLFGGSVDFTCGKSNAWSKTIMKVPFMILLALKLWYCLFLSLTNTCWWFQQYSVKKFHPSNSRVSYRFNISREWWSIFSRQRKLAIYYQQDMIFKSLVIGAYWCSLEASKCGFSLISQPAQ